MRPILQSREAVRREVKNQLENYDMSCYRLGFDDLADAVTNNFEDFLDEIDFEWGNEMPEMSDEMWEELTKEYEV